ncbi:MAG: hypothetical protein IKB15_02475 [Alistipes sp.]|nr:hypothetical protein [Alistipes sp.]
MELDNIKQSAERINTLIKGWETNGAIPRIERDMALEELRKLYGQLLDMEMPIEQSSTIAEQPVAAPVVVATTTACEVEDDVAVDAGEKIEKENSATEEAFAEQPAEDTQIVENKVVDDDDDVLDIDALLGLSSAAVAVAAATTSTAAELPVAETTKEETPTSNEPESIEQPEEIVAEIVTATPAPAPAPAPAPESIPEPPRFELDEAPSATTGALFAVEDIPTTKRGSRKMISLYNAAGGASAVATTAAATTTAVAAESAESIAQSAEVAEPQPKRLADVLGGDKRVLAEKIAAEEKPTTPFNRITDLRKAIGINDKFLMIKDLFGGNAAQYEATIDTLNEFDDLDDCMIYIVENFSWNPDSEGAKLLVSLIERKLS